MALMAKIIRDRLDRADDLVASGEQVNMRFARGARSLSLRAGKAFHVLVKNAGLDLAVDKKHRMKLGDLRDIAMLSEKQFADLVYELQSTMVEITYWGEIDCSDAPGSRHAPIIDRMEMVMSGPLLDFVERPKKGDGTISYRFSEPLRHVFRSSSQWAIISRRAVMSFTSRYALRLFEILSSRLNLRLKTSEIFNVEDLRARLGVPDDTLVRWDHFRSRALEPAVAEVTSLSGIGVEYKVIKHARSVTGVQISWTVKEASGLEAAAKELDSHSAGRQARREGTVETPVDIPAVPTGFPEDGSIAYSGWGETVRRLIPVDTPDCERVASQFRKFCRGKSLSLKASNIDRVFATFCVKWRG